MKNQLYYYSALLCLFFASGGCINNTTPVSNLAPPPPFVIKVRDHEAQQKLQDVEVSLKPAGSSSTIITKKTDPNGEVSFDNLSISDGCLISFMMNDKHPVTITIDKRSSLDAIEVELYDIKPGNNTINGKVISSQSTTVRNLNPPNETVPVSQGRYSLTTTNSTGPFRIEYLTTAVSIQLTVTRPDGGSATIDVAFDDTPIGGK